MAQLVRVASAERDLDVVVDVSTGAPTVLHWGAPLGEADVDALAAALDRPIVNGTFDVVAPISVVPEHGSGFTGRPGLVGRRGGGRAWSPRFRTVSHELALDPGQPAGPSPTLSGLFDEAQDGS